MDEYKHAFHSYELASQVAEGRGVVYKSSKTGPYKITSKPSLIDPYYRPKEKAKLRKLFTAINE